MKDENIKINLYRIKSLLIQKKYLNRKIKSNEMIYLMNQFIDNLKMINQIYTYADIESLKYGSTAYPDNLYKDELNNKYCFFGIISGFIDGIYDKIKYNPIVKNIRDEILNNFFDNVILYNSSFFKKIILEESCHNNFNSYFNLFNKDKLILNFIYYYNIGYENYYRYDIYNIYDEYHMLLSNYINYVNTNKINTDKMRVKKKIL